ncbi:MAG TPA: chaperone modulator CbpM [Arenicellales bacterium]|nr:chaperone modulator CbpM [Arenicellales bacterium]
MVDDRNDVLRGYLLDETVVLTLEELSGACRVHEKWIVELVEEGVIEPQAGRQGWVFRATELRRARRAVRLQRDLEVNAAGVALVLDLLEEVEALRARAVDL